MSPTRTDLSWARDAGGMGRIRFCASCGVRLPRNASPRRRYCDDVCRAQGYRARKTFDRIMGLALMLAEAEWNDDTGVIRLLTCPECGRITFAGGGRRRDAMYCSGRCTQPAGHRADDVPEAPLNHRQQRLDTLPQPIVNLPRLAPTTSIGRNHPLQVASTRTDAPSFLSPRDVILIPVLRLGQGHRAPPGLN